MRKTERRRKNPTRPPLEWARWPIERFEAVEYLSDWTFEVSADFKVDEHFDGWGVVAGRTVRRIVVEFDEETTPYILERKWHQTQRITLLPDGRARLAFETCNAIEIDYGFGRGVGTPWLLRLRYLNLALGAVKCLASSRHFLSEG